MTGPVRWRVDDGPRGALATWTSASRLPVTSARPEVTLRGEPLLPVTLAPDGYTLSVPAPSGTSPDDLDVTLSGRELDAAGERRAPRSGRSGAPAAAPQGPDLGVDPGEPGPHDVVSSDYGLVAVFPVAGVSVVDGYGSAAVEDDETRPRVTVKAPASVREGDPIRIVVTLGRPAGVDVVAEPSFLRPDLAPRAGVADLPATWVRRFTSADRRNAPLWERYLELYADVEPGRRSATLTIPTRADGVRERAERLRVRVDVPLLEQRFSPTVIVRDR